MRGWLTRPAVRITAQIVFVAAVVGLVAWRVDWRAMGAALHPRHPWILIGAISANFISVIWKGVAWKGVVDALPELRRPTRLTHVISPIFVGFLFNTVLAARLGEVVKVMLLRKRLTKSGTPVTFTTLIGTVVVENLAGTITWVLFVIGIGLFLPLPTYAWIASLAMGAGCLLVVIAAVMQPRRRNGSSGRVGSGLWGTVVKFAGRLWKAIEDSHVGLRDPRAMSVVIGGSLMTWVFQLVGIYATLYAFGLRDVGWGGAGLLLVTVTLAQAFPVLPGNLLLFQAAATVPLTTSYGVSMPDAIAFSIVLQFTEVVVGVAFGFVFLLFEGVSFGELRREARREGSYREATTGAHRIPDEFRQRPGSTPPSADALPAVPPPPAAPPPPASPPPPPPPPGSPPRYLRDDGDGHGSG